MTAKPLNSLDTFTELETAHGRYRIASLSRLSRLGWGDLNALPFSLRVLLENLLRHEDGHSVTEDDIRALVHWPDTRTSEREIAFRPARVLMQDFTGVPAIVDLAAMRDAMAAAGEDPARINPLTPVDLVIDHSVMVDAFGHPQAFEENVRREFERNRERYAFLRWGQRAFDHFRVVPPGTGICHQVNLEYLAQAVWSQADDSGAPWAFPDTLVGTDSHTTMINGLGVLGWGVGGIEAEAAMLGQPVSMLIPEVIGVRLTGQLRAGVTATDLVLTLTEQLRQRGVVGKFVEFFGPGLDHLLLADRATIANMAPEYGATCGFFPIDHRTVEYLRLTGRDAATVERVEAYCRHQGLWRDADTPDPVFTDVLTLDLDTVVPSLAGPRRPQDRVPLPQVRERFSAFLTEQEHADPQAQVPLSGQERPLQQGDVVIAAITSCTNTSNPAVMLAAGLVARKAVGRGLRRQPWVKTSLAPGSRVVSDYLQRSGLQQDLDALGFHLVGYGCTTCIGNSGPLPAEIESALQDSDLTVAAVLSGNRNFEGRIHPLVRANWLASPPLVVLYALTGTLLVDLERDPIGHDVHGQPVYLRDLWPSPEELREAMATLTGEAFQRQYASVFEGDALWQALPAERSLTYPWDPHSTYIQHPPYFQDLSRQPRPPRPLHRARILAILGDSITTDHISPAGSIQANSPAGQYLQAQGVEPLAFNSYGSRRGNHEVMVRGTFANVRLRNQMVPDVEGGFTRWLPQDAATDEVLPLYDAAMLYQQGGVDTVVIAGKEYGTGSSRDWAAKGTLLLGVRAVLAESFERIHRSNLVGMGILPLQFPDGVDRHTLELDGTERISVEGLEAGLSPGQQLTVRIDRRNGDSLTVTMRCRIDTATELAYYEHGGILPYVLRQRMDTPS